MSRIKGTRHNQEKKGITTARPEGTREGNGIYKSPEKLEAKEDG